MRYILLIYSQDDESATPEEHRVVAAGHRAVMEETSRQGIFCAADPLQSIFSIARTSTKLSWAAKIPTACCGASGCVEVRPIREFASPFP